MTPGITVTRILRNILRIPVPNTVRQLGNIERLSLAVTEPVIGNNLSPNRALLSIVSENILSSGAFDVPAVPSLNITRSKPSKSVRSIFRLFS